MNHQKQGQVVLERSARLKIDQVHMAMAPFEHGYFVGSQRSAGAQTCPNQGCIIRSILPSGMGARGEHGDIFLF